ncbi:MAG: hypothetical protein ACYSTY_13825, partial [Planctomycetota bacterium]
MSNVSDANLERLNELLAERATQRLSPQESQELDALLAAHPEVDELAFDRAAAAAEVALLAGEYEPMP